MNDMSRVILPKSDQINADDLIAGPRTIRITKVVVRDSGEQKVSVFFEGDDGKPWKPCKTMCRVLVEAWGLDSKLYVGRSVTLFRDPKASYSGAEVGGIRISHLSHIERDIATSVTVTRGKRAPYTVKVLQQSRETPSEGLLSLLAAYEMTSTMAEIEALVGPTRALFPALTADEKAEVRAAAALAKDRAKTPPPADAGDAYEDV